MTEPRQYPPMRTDHTSYGFADSDLRNIVIIDTRDCPGAAVGHATAAALEIMKAASFAESRIPKADPVPKRREPTIRRNARCPCGSGRKFKACCMRKEPDGRSL